MPISILPFFLLALPLLEIAVFILVGSQIGVLATVLLVIATTIAGSLLMRMQGFGVLRQIRQASESGGVAGREIVHGVMILMAGLLLFVPGFITDVLGLLLFIPPVRDLAWRRLRQRIVIVAGRQGRGWRGGGQPRPPQGRPERVIDLDSGDYTSGPDENSPWRKPRQ